MRKEEHRKIRRALVVEAIEAVRFMMRSDRLTKWLIMILGASISCFAIVVVVLTSTDKKGQGVPAVISTNA